MDFEVVKGTKDSEPKDMIKINYILDIIRENFEKFGFRPFDTPIIENLDILVGKYDKDSEIVNEIYKLSDRGERKLGLRYDLTVPLCRYVASKKQLKLPFRRYAIGKVFRDGPLKKGRLREFIQCDGDVVGINGIEIEAELLDLFYRTYSQIGIKSIIEINNNKILRGVFLQFGFKEKDLTKLILSVDKLKKIGKEGVLDEIKEKGFDSKKAGNAILILQSRDFKSIKKLAKNDLLIEGIKELEDLTKLLDNLKVEYRVNFSMSRGLDIYTGNIWEAYDKEEKVTSSIGSGGRYDKVIGDYTSQTCKVSEGLGQEISNKFLSYGEQDSPQIVSKKNSLIGNNKEYPAVGISFGLVPILSLINDKNSKESLTEILIIPLKESLVSKSFEIANKLREEGKNVEINYSFKLKKAFNYADYLGIENIILFGEKDIENKEFIIKNLKSKKETRKNL